MLYFQFLTDRDDCEALLNAFYAHYGVTDYRDYLKRLLGITHSVLMKDVESHTEIHLEEQESMAFIDKHGNMTKVPSGYVKWYEWAYEPEGIKQVGCIYTAQGFEFDYIGVIVGDDIIYDKKNDCLIGNINGTKDPTLKRGIADFDKYVKNIYRVLMTRGMKGCYVYFVNKEVEQYFRDRIISV